MSTVRPAIDGFVGYGDGLEALLRSDEDWDADHPLVRERPELFTAPEPEPVKRQPRTRKAKADTDA